MTLVVIPVAYSLMDDFVNLMKRIYLGRLDVVEPEAPAQELAVSTAKAIERVEKETFPVAVPEPAGERFRPPPADREHGT
jgi:hypothetical protein